MTQGFWAQGLTMDVNGTEVAEVLDVTGPSVQRDTFDMTNHSTVGGWEDVIATIKRSQPLTFEVNYIPDDPSHAAATGMPLHFNSGDVVTVSLTMADDGASVISFSALVLGIEPRNPVNGPGRLAITIKPVGAVTFP